MGGMGRGGKEMRGKGGDVEAVHPTFLDLATPLTNNP
jgi:hypothetical protein